MMAMFVWNRLRYDLVALLGLLIAVACGTVPVEEAFAGFSDPVVVIVASVLVISAGLGKSNAIGRLIRRVQPYMRTTGRQVLVLTSGVAIMSAFMKNIGALAVVAAGLAFLSVGWRLLRASRLCGCGLRSSALPVRGDAADDLATVADLEAIGEGNVAVAAIIREKDRRHIPTATSTLLAERHLGPARRSPHPQDHRRRG
jgi:hypothetical protein